MGLVFSIQPQAGLTSLTGRMDIWKFQYSMELEPRVSAHAASMLAGLNLQRGRVQFCDCLVGQRESPGQFYPAHRCVLAASSPVLASILSSNGTLVELQDPCLSDSVLAHLFDYIYTGTLPNIYSQQQHYSLLTAAHYLQMDELQEALRAWQPTEANDGDNTKNTFAGPGILQYKAIASPAPGKFPPLSPSMNVFRQPAQSSLHRASYLEKKDGHFSESVEMYDAQTLSVKTGSCTKDGGKSTRSNSMNDDTSPSGKDASTLGDVNAICCASESTVNNHGIQVTDLMSQNLMENMKSAAEVQGVSRVGKHGRNDLFHSMGTVKLHTWQRSKEEELFRTVKDERGSDSPCGVAVQENTIVEKTQLLKLTLKVEAEDKQANAEGGKKRQSPLPPPFSSPVSLYISRNSASPTQSTISSCSTSLPPRFGAVPVICHSSRAAVVQVTEASTRPLSHPVSQASTCSNRAPVLQSTCTDNNSIVRGIVPQRRTCNWERNQDYRGNKDHFCKQNLEDQYRLGQCVLQDSCYKPNTDQSDTLKRDYNSSTTDHCIIQNDKPISDALSHITRGTMGENCGQNVNSTKHVRDESLDESLLQENEGSQYGSGHPSTSHFPAKPQRLKYNECKDISLSTASRESIHSQVKSPVAPVTAQGSYKGQEFNCEMICLKSEVKEECSHCNLYGSKADLFQKDGVYLPVSTTQDSGLDHISGGFCAFEQCTSLEPENMSTSETLETHTSASVPAESTVSFPGLDFVGQSYQGQLHYHCLGQEDTHTSSHPDHPDQSSDETEAGAYASPLRQHSATMNKDVLLLDISTKPTELYVSYKHKSTEGDKVVEFDKTDTFQPMIWNNHGDEQDSTYAANDSTNISARADFESGSFVKDESKAWIQETSAEHRKPVGTSQHKSGGGIVHKAEPWVLEEVSKASGKQTNTLTCYTSARFPGSVQTTMPSTLSVYIPSTLSTTMPTNISAPLSTPEPHLFQCSLCDRCFSQRGSLNRHVRSHLGVRPFPCPQCPMTFSRQYRVTEHMRVHQRCAVGSHFQKPPV